MFGWLDVWMVGWMVDRGGDVLLGVLGVRDSWCS